eukprot:g242.t1
MRVCHDEILRPLDGADVDTPRGERAKQEVRRLRGMIEQRVLGEEAEAELREQFDRFDKDGSGEIDEKELGRLIKAIGLRRSKQQVTAMVMSVDDDGSGEISWEEFLNLLNVEIQPPKVVEDIEICWDEPYGTIMYSEGDVCDSNAANGDMPCSQPRYYYKEGDIDELIELAAKRLAEERKWLSAEQKQVFQATFDRFDDDNSGTMDVDELTILVGELKLDCTKEELLEAAPPGKNVFSFRDFCEMMVNILKNNSDADDIMASLDGSKSAAEEEAAARIRDSGALVMWG